MRWLSDDDIPALYEIFSDPEVMKYWSSAPLRDRQGAEALLRQIHTFFVEGTLYQWGIARKRDDRVIGTCTLAAITPEHKRAELGFALGRAFWGQGYAGEAVSTLLRYAFDSLSMRRIEADADPANAASIRLLERLGFRREGYARERYQIEGRLYDAILYGLLRDEFRRS